MEGIEELVAKYLANGLTRQERSREAVIMNRTNRSDLGNEGVWYFQSRQEQDNVWGADRMKGYSQPYLWSCLTLRCNGR